MEYPLVAMGNTLAYTFPIWNELCCEAASFWSVFEPLSALDAARP
jgi:hypothetical protein